MPSAPTSDNAAEDSDESLMLRFAAGDIAAFDALYARHELGVWRYVFRSVRVQAVADDLLQDVWFAVARSAPTYTVSARFKTWLFTMAHNRLIDYFRTARNHVSIDGNGDEDSPAIGDTLAADSGFGLQQEGFTLFARQALDRGDQRRSLFAGLQPAQRAEA